MHMIYLNNQWLEATTPSISNQDRGFLLGDGIFETLKVENRHIHFFADHWERLVNSATFLKIPLSITQIELEKTIYQLLQCNQLEEKVAVVRVTLTRGVGERGLKFPKKMHPTLLITANEYIGNNKSAYCLFISTFRKNEYSPLSNIKSINYLENILAHDEAITKGYDDALFLNTKENLTETTVANLFMVFEKTIVTPPISEGIFPGIMRSQVISLAKKRDIELIQRPLSLNSIEAASEAFISNVLIGLLPVNKINDHAFSSDNIIYQRLIK